MRVRFSAASSLLATAMSSRPPVRTYSHTHSVRTDFSCMFFHLFYQVKCNCIYSTEVAADSPTPESINSSPATLIFSPSETLINAEGELIIILTRN